MSKKNSKQSWILSGYEQFANEGLEGIQIERLARITDLNKSGYYHYFGHRNRFLEDLMKHHVAQAELIANDMRLIKQFDPDFIHVLLKYPVAIMVHMQLVRNRHDNFLNEVYTKVNGITDPPLVPSWAEFIGTPDNHEFAFKYFQLARDMFYSRITFKTLNHDFLHDLIYEVKGLLQEAIKMESNPR